MKIIKYDNLDYTLYQDTLDNGLRVMYLKKPGFHKYSCYFGSNIGGKVNKYEVDGIKYEIPLGVAHFLEHQMFEMPNGVNASDYLSQYGIDNNAYTSYDKTMYLVSGTEYFDVALNYLLDFVQTPYFKNENIDVEREIIIQELMMYADRPQNKIRDRIKKNVYGNISYANDIGGNVEEVKKIDENILNQVYHHFYIPQNMYLGIIGSFEAEDVFKLIKENQAKKTFNNSSMPKVLLDLGPKDILIKEDSMNLDIADDCISYFVKIKFDESYYINKKENNILTTVLDFELLTEILFGPSSKNYQILMDKDLVNVGFSCSVNVDENFFYLTFAGYSHHPKELIEFLNDQFKNLNNLEIDDNYLNSLNKASLGLSIREYNYFDNTISNALEYAMDGVNSMDYYNYQTTKENIKRAISTIDINNIAYVIGYGKNK